MNAPVFSIAPEHRFRLAPGFLDQFHGDPPGWGPLGGFVFRRSYARTIEDVLAPRGERSETPREVYQRVTEFTFSAMRKQIRRSRQRWDESEAQRKGQDFFTRLWQGKFSGSGRMLWILGTPALERIGAVPAYNCFAGDTEFVTKEHGSVVLSALSGQQVTVLTREGWMPAEVQRFGTQWVQRVTFAPANPAPRGHGGWRIARSNIRHVVTVTPDHRWIRVDGSETTALAVGDTVAAAFNRDTDVTESYLEGKRHGVIFGDGTSNGILVDGTHRYQVRLCGAKAEALGSLFTHKVYPPSSGGDPHAMHGSRADLKDFPAEDVGTDYLRGFLDGWIATDGCDREKRTARLASQHRGAYAWLLRHSARAGYLLVGANEDSVTETNYGPRSATCWRFSLTRAADAAWKVVAIEPLEERVPVYCAVVPGVRAFALSTGIYTGNCAFVSTRNVSKYFSRPFVHLMDLLMLGVGVGFDVRGAGQFVPVKPDLMIAPFVVEDTRESWCDAMRAVLDAFAGRGALPVDWDVSRVRPEGTPIKTFGGTASGPEPLLCLLRATTEHLLQRIGQPLNSADIVDLMNRIGVCVVAGNVRRSSEIALGYPNDAEFISLKDPALHAAALRSHRWASNNSVFADGIDDFEPLAAQTAKNGEPGYVWLDVIRRFGRLADPPDTRDAQVLGLNPCGEIPLEDNELCNVPETFPGRHDSLEDYLLTLRCAYILGKVISLIPTHDDATNEVITRNRRIGISMAGVAAWYDRLGMRECIRWWNAGYQHLRTLDESYSGWMGVNRSIRLTSVKPGGSTPLVWGQEGGMKWASSPQYLRAIRIGNTSPLLPPLERAGYRIEPALTDPKKTSVVYFPVRDTNHRRTAGEVSLWEKATLLAALQAHWADNSVSNTLEFSPRESLEIAPVLRAFEGRLKSVSFLPLEEHGYAQAPYQPLTPEQYEAEASGLRPVKFSDEAAHDTDEKYCTSDVCMLPPNYFDKATAEGT